MTKSIVTAALVAAVGATDQTLFTFTCDGTAHFAPTSPLGSSFDGSHVYGAAMKALTTNMVHSYKQVCPSITEQMVWDHLIPFNFDAILNRVSPGDQPYTPVPLPAECADVVYAEMDYAYSGVAEMGLLPTTCSHDKWKTDKCKIKFNMTNVMPGFPMDLQVTMAHCPGKPLPSATMHCLGENCQYFGKFCESNADCGGTECKSLTTLVESVGEELGLFTEYNYTDYTTLPPTPMGNLKEAAVGGLTEAFNAINIVMAAEEEKCVNDGYSFAGRFLYKAQNMFNYATGSTAAKLNQKFSDFKMCGLGYIDPSEMMAKIGAFMGEGTTQAEAQAIAASFFNPATADPKLQVKAFGGYQIANQLKTPVVYGDCFGNYQWAHPSCPFHARAVMPLWSQLATMFDDIMKELMPCRSATANWNTILPEYFYPWSMQFFSFVMRDPAATKVGRTTDASIQNHTIKALLFPDEFSLGIGIAGMPTSCNSNSMAQGKCGFKLKLDELIKNLPAPTNNGAVQMEFASCPKQGYYPAGKFDCQGGICALMNAPYKVPAAQCVVEANTGCPSGYYCTDLKETSDALVGYDLFMSDFLRLLVGETTSDHATICVIDPAGDQPAVEGQVAESTVMAWAANTVNVDPEFTKFSFVPNGNMQTILETINVPTTVNPPKGAPGTIVDAGTADKPNTRVPDVVYDFGGNEDDFGGNKDDDISGAHVVSPSVVFAAVVAVLALY
jgi:hypothetical protein